MVALVTPMQESGEICWETLAGLIEFHLMNGTQGIVAVGTTGESATLSVDEHTEVIRFVIDKVAGQVPVIAGTGANATSEAIELTQKAKALGADACLLVTPYYNKPTQEGLYQHFKAIAAVDIPQILYNVPSRTGCDLLPETVARLQHHANIIGIKEATGNLARMRDILRLCPSLLLFSGDDESSMEFMLQGGHGVISVTANVAPKAMRNLCDLSIAREQQQAGRINALLLPLHQSLFVEANPIPVKYALSYMGLIPAGIRLPLTPLSLMFHERLQQALYQSGVTA